MKRKVLASSVFNAEGYKAPVSKFPYRINGNVEIVKDTYYKDSFYTMENVMGKEYFYTGNKPMEINLLQINHKTWMIDDPLHWFGTHEFLANAMIKTNPETLDTLLVAGLGLGLIIMAALEYPFKEIIVIEREKAVIELISLNLNELYGDKMRRVKIINDDFYHYCAENHNRFTPSVVYADLAVGNPEETKIDLLKMITIPTAFWPNTPVAVFGARGKNGLGVWFGDKSKM